MNMFPPLSLVAFSPSRSEVPTDIPFTFTMSGFSYPKGEKAELAERWTELPQVSDESRSFFRVHTGYFSNIPKCIKAEFIASWACSQSSVVSSSKR
ncbi:hypothetical protein TNCV_2816681 [Trichonephila clavipes]|nr:hypothetical protein TNCV_2816681 [Trichonephila clavipes]